MPCDTLYHLRMMSENLPHLLFLHLELFLVRNGEPPTTSINLKFVRELGFEGGFFDHTEELCLETI